MNSSVEANEDDLSNISLGSSINDNGNEHDINAHLTINNLSGHSSLHHSSLTNGHFIHSYSFRDENCTRYFAVIEAYEVMEQKQRFAVININSYFILIFLCFYRSSGWKLKIWQWIIAGCCTEDILTSSGSIIRWSIECMIYYLSFNFSAQNNVP